MLIPRLTPRNQDTFFNNVNEGDNFTFSDAFDLQMVRVLALKAGWFINYYYPRTQEYTAYGSSTCRVCGRAWENNSNDVLNTK